MSSRQGGIRTDWMEKSERKPNKFWCDAKEIQWNKDSCLKTNSTGSIRYP